MTYPWLRAIPLVTTLACLPALAPAQAMSGIGLDGFALESVTAAATAASPASAPTFTQLSRPATRTAAANGTATAALVPADEEKDHEYLTLALAGLAALAFVSRRQRRAASQPVSAEPA
jgi:hypothetical protein